MRFLLAFEFIITVIWFWNLCEHIYCLFLVLCSTLITNKNMFAQVNAIPILNGSSFKIWKEKIEIVLDCVELDLALRMKRPTSTPENLNEDKIEE